MLRWPTTLTVQTSEINNLKLTPRQNTQNSRRGKKIQNLRRGKICIPINHNETRAVEMKSVSTR